MAKIVKKRGGLKEICLLCYAESSTRHIKKIATKRAELKAMLVGRAGNACSKCGRAFPPNIMDFHHKDPARKVLGISRMSNTSGKDMADEVSKCDLLCPKCHRDAHYGGKGPATHPKDKTRVAYKAKFVKAFGSRCAICNEKYEDYIFDFHHVDESIKLYSISKLLIKNINYQRAVDELQKCVMLCVTCHRLLHTGYVKLPNDIKVGPHVDLKSKRPPQPKCTCVCGALLTKGAPFCRKCTSSRSRKVERPSKEQLVELLKGHSYLAVAKMYKVCDNTIRKWLK